MLKINNPSIYYMYYLKRLVVLPTEIWIFHTMLSVWSMYM